MKKVKTKIKVLIAQRDLTQLRLAECAGVSVATVNKLSQNKAEGISWDVLEKLCHYLQCEITDILELQ
jgi:putative transcriptional regulator